MKSTNNIIEQAIDNIASRVPGQGNKGDYIGEDGLLYCSNCHTPKQCWVEFFGKQRAMPILCRCLKEKEEAQQAEEERAKASKRIALLKRECFPAAEYEHHTFDEDDRHDPKISDAMKRYADRFEEMQAAKMGLLLYGSVGTGKTFFAACIANVLMDREIQVLMTSFSRIVNTMQGMNNGRQAYLDKLANCPLLIIDDLGAERSSDYMLEQVYTVVDARYQTGKPMIITTNVSIDEIKKPSDIKYKRIYDRILERCHPVQITGHSRRREALISNFAERQKLLGL